MTTRDVWDELHETIWRDLQLPFADSFFLTNHSELYPNQVNVRDHPDILRAHPHDTMHTWGDYCFTTTKRFSRHDALDGLRELERVGQRPLVWSDHSNFAGNLLHNTTLRNTAEITTASGYSFANLEYTLDLIYQAGVRYIWDGTITDVLAQDRPVSREEWHARYTSSWLKRKLKIAAEIVGMPLWKMVDARVFSLEGRGNAQYCARRFADGRSFYVFPRFGPWNHADIDGFGRILAADRLAELVRVQGTAICYSHLGLRHASRRVANPHIPQGTRESLHHLAELYRQQTVMVSPTSQLLDYLVLRDHAIVEDETIDFRSDKIRFVPLSPDELSRFQFGVWTLGGDFRVSCDGREVPFEREHVEENIYRVQLCPLSS